MKEIILTQGKKALVDDEDFEDLSQFKWHTKKGSNNVFYAEREVWIDGKRTSEKMHRRIMKATDRKILIDHKDHDGINNQKYNLRFSTHAQNNSNRRGNRGSISKYIGVSKMSSTVKGKTYSYWIAKINGRFLGTFKTEEEAAKVRDIAATEMKGEFAKLNFVQNVAS